RGRRSRVEHRPHSVTLAEGDGRVDSFERNLELHEDEIASLQDIRRAIEVRGRKIGVRSFYDEDRVLSRWLDHDRRDAAGLPLDAPDVARIDPEPIEIADGGVCKHVIADGCDHHHESAQLGCRRSLIGSLAAMSHLEAWRL